MARNQPKGTVLRSPMAAMRQRTKLRSEVGGEQPKEDYAENLKFFRDFGNADEGKISEDAVKFAQKNRCFP